jgi:hypothetical protein
VDLLQAASAASPIFSGVIPTYRRHQQLGECLDCLALYFDGNARRPQCPIIEVIVSDDAHEEELRLGLQQLYPCCRYVQGPTRGLAQTATMEHARPEAPGLSPLTTTACPSLAGSRPMTNLPNSTVCWKGKPAP